MTTRMYQVVSRAQILFFKLLLFYNMALVKPDVILDNKKIQANLDMTGFNRPQNHVTIIL